MDEYIKAKDLVDMLEQRLVFQETHGFYRDAGYTSRFIESIADMPHIDVVPKSEWISVEDRLPETRENVLGYSDKDGGCIFIGYYESEWDLWGEYGLLHLGHVLYWMPLPEPPKEETTNL